MFEINTEKEFYQFLDKMLSEGRITTEEYKAMEIYVCGLYDMFGYDEDDDY